MSVLNGCRIWGSAALLLVMASQSAWAQAPSITEAWPRAAKPGETVMVKIRGAHLANPGELWLSFPGQATLAADVPNNTQNSGEVVFQVNVPPDAPVGVHGIRLATDKGISNLFLFAVDELPSIAQAKPNNSSGTAQALPLPCAVDGSIDSLTRNYYKFSVQPGQEVSFEVLARRLGSPLDPMIRLFDLEGHELAYSDDAPGLGGDARLAHRFEKGGDYLLEVRDIRFQGGGNYSYRLRIGDFPCVSVPVPMGVQRGASASVAFAGPRIEGVSPATIQAPTDPAVNWWNLGAKRTGGLSSGFAVLSVGSGEEALEQEPNDEPQAATRVNAGASLNGRFEKPGDVDRFVFTAKAGQHFRLSGVTRRQGSPADLYLRLLKSDGAQVAAADDAGTEEGFLDFAVPADGDYTLVVEDLHRRGGPEFAYRIDVKPYSAGFELTASADTLNVPQEGTATITVTANRKGYNGPIELALLNAPAGIAATPTVIGPGMNSVVFTIESAGNVPSGKVYRTQVVGKAKIGDSEFQAVADVSSALQAALNSTPLPPQALSDSIALGVSPRPFFVLRNEPREVVLGKHLSASVRIKSLRAGEFAEAITVEVEPKQNGLPAGVTAAVKPIEKGQNEVEIVFSADGKALLGSFNVVLQGTGKQGDATVVQAAPSIRLDLRPPYTLKTDFGGAKLARGGTLAVKVIADRNPAYRGPINVTFENLPKGVTAAAATIPEGQNEIEVALTAAADAQVGAVTNIAVKGEGTANNQKLVESAQNASLTVE